MKIFKNLFIIFVCLTLVFQSLTPSLILAQEATPSATELEPSPTPVLTENQESTSSASLEPSSISESSPTPESSPSATTIPENSGSYTTQTLQLGVTYKFPPNEKVSLTFTKLPENSGTVTIKEIKLTQEQIQQTGALSDTAYEITSTMADGTFEYTLTLPTTKTDGVEVKSSEDGQNFDTLGGVSAQTDTLTITGLTHFTIFVVAGTISSGNSTPFDESNASVVVNEFVFNPSSGNDWVELYNRSNSTVNLANWKLDDNTSTMATLVGSLPAGGFLVFEVSNRLNAASSGDTINLKNSSGELVDQVSYKDSTTINGADNVGSVGTGQSVGRTSDGVISGDIWTKYSEPTKGYNNNLETPTFITVGSNLSYNSIQDAVSNIAEGGTVNVLAGSYDEADIIVETENVTIQGPGTGTGVSRAVVNGNDSCGNSNPPAMFHLHADGITLKGFEIDASNCSEHGVHIDGFLADFQVAGVTVTQNVIYSANYGVTVSLASSYDSERPNIVSENDISQNDTGVYLLSASNNIIRDNNIHENGTYGILLDDEGFGPSNNNQILQNTITENFNDAGIFSGGNSSISNLTISGNEITNNYTGIYLDRITNSLNITNNQITNHDSYGIYLNTISKAKVVIGGSGGGGNTITGNGKNDDGNGIYLRSIQNNSSVSLIGNTISDNGRSNNSSGIYVNNLSDSQNSLTIQGNTISRNFGQGIYLNRTDSATATISQNTILQNGVEEGYAGIFIQNIRATKRPSVVTVSSNTISQNGSYGIDVSRVENSTLTIGQSNTITGNTSAGINLQRRVSGAVITKNNITQNGSGTTGIIVRNALRNQAHLNNISGNGVGVKNQDDENAFDAIENWWGSTLGPKGAGADSASSNVSFEPWCLDQSCQNVFVKAPDNSLLKNVSFGIPPGKSLSDTPSLTFLADKNFTVTHAGGASTITVPNGVVITRSDSADFDANQLTSQDVAVNSLIGLGSGVVADGALQWGLPNIELKFTPAITLSIFVGTSLNGQTLNVVRSTTGAGGWTSGGIVDPGTCVVTGGLCTFQATLASYYSTTRTVTATTSTGGGQALSQAGGPVAAPTCGDTKPGSAPTLTGAVTGTNSVTLTWSKAANPVTYYLATYGLSSGAQQYGNPNVGGSDTTSYTVSGLSGGTTYYFKVRAGNGCAPGDFSNELSATPGGGFVTGPAAGFAPGVLGTKTEEADVGVGEEGQIQGETTEPTQPSPTTQPTSQFPVDVRTIVIVAIALLLGFGVFKLLVK